MVLGALGLKKLVDNVVGVGSSQTASKAPGFHKTLQAADFMDTITPTDVMLTASKWTELGSYTVPAQQAIRWGHGSADRPANQGYVYFIMIDDTAGDATQEDGLLRLVVADANRLNKRVVWEGRTEELDGDANDKAKRIALPEQGPLAREDDLLILEVYADATDIIQPDFSIVRIPVTLYQ